MPRFCSMRGGASSPGTFITKWDAYPIPPPTSTFPPIQLARGLYYVNAFEL